MARSLNESNDAFLRFEDPEIAPESLFQLGLAFRDAGFPRNAVNHFHGSAPLYLRLGQSEQAAPAFAEEILAFRTHDRVVRFVPLLLESSQLYDQLDPPELAAQLHLLLGVNLLESGNLQPSVRSFEKSANLYSELGLPCQAADSFHYLGQVYGELGEPEKSAQAMEKAKESTACAAQR